MRDCENDQVMLVSSEGPVCSKLNYNTAQHTDRTDLLIDAFRISHLILFNW